MITTRCSSLDAFWSLYPGIVRGDLTVLINMLIMAKEVLGLDNWFPPLCPYPLYGEMEMVLTGATLRLYIIKGGYIGYLQWDSMKKEPTEWSNIYGSGVLGMGGKIL